MFWNTEKNEKINAEFDENFSDFMEVLANRAWLWRVLSFCLFCLFSVWGFVIFFSNIFLAIVRVLGGFTSKQTLLLLGIPFILGIVSAYSIFRLKFPDIEENKLLESDLMASISYEQNANKRWFIWIFSILFGLINILLVIFTAIFLENNGLYLFEI